MAPKPKRPEKLNLGSGSGSSSKSSKNILQRKYPQVFTNEQLNEMTHQFDKLVGEGKYAKVYKGRLNEEDIAVKMYMEDDKMLWENERQALTILDHPNIVSLIGTSNDNDEKKLYLILNYIPKNLEDFLEERKLEWAKIHKLLLQLASAIQEISVKGFVVGDIKPDNVLLDEEYNVHLCDFGSAKKGGKDIPTINRHYAAKELVINGNGTPAADVYSFGVILLQMIMKVNTFGPISTKKIPLMVKQKRTSKRKGESSSGNEDGDHISVMARRYRNEHIVHKSVINSGCSEEDAIALTRLGISCTDDYIDKRPTIHDVISTLRGLKSKS